MSISNHTSENLTTVLRLLHPNMNSALFSPDARHQLDVIASKLAPVSVGGFECRLSPQEDQVDLLQFLSPENDDPVLLATYIEQSPLSRRIEWQRLARFCRDWTSGGHSIVTGLWLEIDADSFVSGDWLPSLFLQFDRPYEEQQGSPSPEQMIDVVQALTRQEDASALENLRMLARHLPSQAIISHIGLMLSRKVNGLRVNIKRLYPEDVSPYLPQINLTGSFNVDWYALFDLCDSATLCLDVTGAGQVFPQVGVECQFAAPPEREPRWRKLLDLYTPGYDQAKLEALATWTGEITPPAVEEWPSDWLVEAVLRPDSTFAALGRRVSHIKLTFKPDQPAQAKAYIGFGHIWNDTTPPAAASLGPDVNITDLMNRAVKFLLNSRTQPGWWRDFQFPAGSSDEWVTAYVGSVMAALPDTATAAHKAAQRAWTILSARRSLTEGWGYNALVAPDADSTNWGLSLAAAVGHMNSEVYHAKLSFIERHIDSNGGVRTYSGQNISFDHITSQTGFHGWREPHLCVTAAIASNFGYASCLRLLRETQPPNGNWQGYWWYEDAYTTGLAVEAFARYGQPSDQRHIARAGEWAADCALSLLQAGQSAPAFALAWCIKILAHNHHAGCADFRVLIGQATAHLAAHQLPSGAWGPSARLRVPMPDEPSLATSLDTLDQNCVFTTAAVVSALNLIIQLGIVDEHSHVIR